MTIAAFLPASAAEPPKPKARDLLPTWIQAIQPNTPEWKTVLSDGEARSDFCARCHGRDGRSVMALVPNLAGQNPFYLLEQIEQFADGRRRDFIMSPLAKQFSEEDKVVVVFFYSNMKPPQMSADSALAKAGEVVYSQRCVGCHGRDAHGGDKYARLAGQRPEYIKHRLAGFKEAKGGESPMIGMAQGLTAKQVEELAAYLSSLP